jgi:hypothetical protein
LSYREISGIDRIEIVAHGIQVRVVTRIYKGAEQIAETFNRYVVDESGAPPPELAELVKAARAVPLLD